MKVDIHQHLISNGWVFSDPYYVHPKILLKLKSQSAYAMQVSLDSGAKDIYRCSFCRKYYVCPVKAMKGRTNYTCVMCMPEERLSRLDEAGKLRRHKVPSMLQKAVSFRLDPDDWLILDKFSKSDSVSVFCKKLAMDFVEEKRKERR